MRWLVLLWLTLLNGCAMLPDGMTAPAHPAHPESVPFAMNGRVSIDDGGEKHSAGLRWTHTGQSDEILLLNPLGQTVARVYRDDGMATLDDGKKRYQDVDAAALMQQVLGWHLPLSGLHQWILGLPSEDGPAFITRDTSGRIELLRQDGWEVHYLRFADARPDSLPTRLRMNHQDLQVQLLIDEWEWNPK